MLWERRDLECNHFRGAGSSPIIFRNLLIMHFDGSDVQYVIALDKNTGKTVWKTPRSIDFKDLTPDGKPKADGDFRKAFATPHIVDVGGQPLLISLGGKAVLRLRPDDRERALAPGRARQPLGEHASGHRARDGLLSDRVGFDRSCWRSGPTAPATSAPRTWSGASRAACPTSPRSSSSTG